MVVRRRARDRNLAGSIARFLAGLIGAAANVGMLLVGLLSLGLLSFIESARTALLGVGMSNER